MFRTDEQIVHQKISDMRAEVELNNLKKQLKKQKKQAQPPFWIVLLTLLHLRKEK